MSDGRVNAILVAIILSVMVHVGLMLWIRPQVMTQVARGFAHVTRHVDTLVAEDVPEGEPSAMELFEDEAARLEAPEAETDAATALAAAEPLSALPLSETAQLNMPKPADISERLARQELITAPPHAFNTEVVQVTESKPQAPAKMAFEMKPAEATTPHRPKEAPPAVTETVEPVVAEVAPDFKVLDETPAAVEAEKTEKLVKEEPKTDYKPAEEVMNAVDEQVVMAEKDAVRELINSYEAEPMTAAVDMKLTRMVSEGYTYFKVHVTPKADLPIIPKDMVVLLDTSPSVGRDRLKSCLEAAKELLVHATNTGDRFNLVSFSDRFEYAFPQWQECTAQSFAAADKWIDTRVLHGWTDVFSVIRSVLTLPRDPKRPLIALVVTDGEANAGVADTAKILSRFSELNDGLVSIYMYGVKRAANQELIDFLCRGNRGESFIYREGRAFGLGGPSRADAGEGIAALAERFRMPVVSDLRVVFATGTEAEVYPRLLRNLYRGNAVDILGRVKGTPKELSFSLKGLAGEKAYESFYKLNFGEAAQEEDLVSVFGTENEIARRCR